MICTKWNPLRLGAWGWCSSPCLCTAAGSQGVRQAGVSGVGRWAGLFPRWSARLHPLHWEESSHRWAAPLPASAHPPLSQNSLSRGRWLTLTLTLTGSVIHGAILQKSNRKLFHKWCHMLPDATKMKIFLFSHCQNVLKSFKKSKILHRLGIEINKQRWRACLEWKHCPVWTRVRQELAVLWRTSMRSFIPKNPCESARNTSPFGKWGRYC